MDNKKQLQPISDLSVLNAISGGGGYKGPGPKVQKLIYPDDSSPENLKSQQP